MTFCPALLLPGFSAAWVGAAGLNGQSVPMPGVVNTAQARVDYPLKWQGCHRIDGGGDDRSNPPMRDMVARFLTVSGGREFFARVPGVATVDLDVSPTSSIGRSTPLIRSTLPRTSGLTRRRNPGGCVKTLASSNAPKRERVWWRGSRSQEDMGTS